MRLSDKTKALLRKLFVGNASRFKIALTAGITWVITRIITETGLDIGEDFRDELSTYVAMSVWVFIQAMVARYLDNGVRDFQQIIPNPAVIPDGDPGPVTRAGLKDVVNQAAGAVIQPLTPEEEQALLRAELEIVRNTPV